MVFPLDDDARAALEESGRWENAASAFYGPDMTIEDVPLLTQGSLTFSASAATQGRGTVYLSDDGASMVPRLQTDPLAPFGQELALYRTLQFGQTTVRIPLGRFRIARVPSTRDYLRRLPPGVPLGWSAQLELVDRLDILQNDDLEAITSPKTTSTWGEIQRLSPIPILRSLPDVDVPASLVYTDLPGAITKLMSNLGGEPHMTRDGLLTARRSNKWLIQTTDDFTVRGTVATDSGMSNDLKNYVVVTNPNDANIRAVAQITEAWNPLRVSGPLGRRVYKLADPLMVTQVMADEAAATALARVSTQQAQTVTVTCLPRPDLELGDFGAVIDENTGQTFHGEIASISLSMDPLALMSMTMTIGWVDEQ